jgi:5'-methylthioadenosine phosphorylase
MTKLGIIGGSGLYDLPELDSAEVMPIDTPFGQPSSPPRVGRLGQTDVVFLPRHGSGHRYSPSDLPYRANVYALKALGANHVLSISAVGSLREELPPRSLVLPDQIIDRTVGRIRTFFDRDVVAHVGLADPFCSAFRDQIAVAARAAGQTVHAGGAYVCIEGPQFSTRAESQLYRAWNATVIGMTAMPEARLAREAELCYATLALVTDYDVWHSEAQDVSVEFVLSHLQANLAVAAAIIRQLANHGLPSRSCSCADALRHAIVTDPNVVTGDQRDRLGIIAARYLAAANPADT